MPGWQISGVMAINSALFEKRPAPSLLKLSITEYSRKSVLILASEVGNCLLPIANNCQSLSTNRPSTSK